MPPEIVFSHKIDEMRTDQTGRLHDEATKKSFELEFYFEFNIFYLIESISFEK